MAPLFFFSHGLFPKSCFTKPSQLGCNTHKQVHILSRNQRRNDKNPSKFILLGVGVSVEYLFLLLEVGISFQMAPAYFLVFFLLSHPLLLHSAEGEEEKQSDDIKCPPFYCRNPDHMDEHGRLTVDNCSELIQEIHLKSGGEWYPVVSISAAANIRIHNQSWLLDQFRDTCTCKSSENFLSPSISFNTTSNLTQSQCYGTPRTYFSYISLGACNWSFLGHPQIRPPLPLPQCSTIQTPMSITRINDHSFSLPAADIFFQVHLSEFCFKCYYKGSECYIDSQGNFQCDKGNNKLRVKVGLGITVALAVGIGVLIFYCFWGNFSSNKSMVFWRKKTPNHQNVEVFIRNYRSIFPKRYSYSDVKKMTSSFKDKLGQGGYGGVFKGKLLDGRLVAVKVLNKSKGDGQEFVNEVASISRTSHVNIVTLLGFCFEGSQRALIYEFMPNGSLEKFIYEKNTLRENCQLGWEILYQIAIGIARGLEYLHGGCNTRILHFDIKPHNILLDQDCCPKISDFGLAKLCPKNESIISMTGARGTPGYIAPEVFCRNFGGVSHKSDVYSYGMMILEMVGGRKNIDVGVEHSSEIYFPHWIYKRLEQGDKLGLHGLMNEEENERARKMILVGLWCIQSDPSNRPPIGRVVDMLQGSVGSLQIPPCPVLSSPSKSHVDSLTSSVMAL